MYFSTRSSRVIAGDPETGREVSQFDPRAAGSGKRPFAARIAEGCTGGAGWRRSQNLFGAFDARLIALDA
jgi:glucose dehydrogenase